MKAVHRFAAALAACTLFLIFVGGLVTSTDSGLSVPDWPLSYGRLMPPMVGGILYEHGHRMVATFVGFLTVLLAIFLSRGSGDRWLKRAGWAAVGLVILQGVFGGLTVLLRLPPAVSIVHACLAQTFFCLTVSLAVWTSRFWAAASPRIEEPNQVPIHRAALALFAVAFIQLLLGAVLRHTGAALPFHIGGAVTLLALTVWIARRAWKAPVPHAALRRLSSTLSVLLVGQICLGIASYFILVHRFETVPPPFWAPATISAHVALGALFLGFSTVLFLTAYRTRPEKAQPIRTTLSDYVTLTKPGISLMNAVTALAGFVLGSGGHVDGWRLFHTCVGTLLAAGGAGTLNMLIERDIDARMTRTRGRPLPSGRLKPGEGLALGVFLAGIGVAYLSWNVNALTAVLGAATVSIYLYIYTPLKKISTACVTAGSVSGALPPVMGWAAATGSLGTEALALFGIMFLWQFPHFLSLAFLYKEDYARGGLHMVSPEDKATAISVLLTSGALAAVSLAPTALHLTGRVYLVTAAGAGAAMIYFATRFFRDPSRVPARHLFLYSLAYIPLLVAMMLLNGPGRS